jgi:hypothetical protein
MSVDLAKAIDLSGKDACEIVKNCSHRTSHKWRKTIGRCMATIILNVVDVWNPQPATHINYYKS